MAELLCQSKLNEMLCGAVPVETIENRPIDDAPGWVLSVALDPVDQSGVVALRVSVAKES